MEAVKYAKPLKINRKENLKNHKWYWIGRRTQDGERFKFCVNRKN